MSNDTLSNPRVSALIERLFGEADASNAKLKEMMQNLPPEERNRRMSDPNRDYRDFYGRAREIFLAVSPETARLLYMLGRTTNATAIVEFGTSFGISTIFMAAALKDNGGGKLIGSELEPTKAAKARSHLAEAGLGELVDIREGDALQTLAQDLPASIDLVLLDGHKPLYSKVLDLLEPQLKVGAVLVADNADACPDYVARMRKPGGGYSSVPFADDVELSIKL